MTPPTTPQMTPPTAPPTRYAVLHHTGVPVPHYDVLVEPRPGADLAAWRSPAWPVRGPTPVERIADHRRAYLDYEGDVGRRRGRVERVVGGMCHVTVGPGDVWTVRPTGGPAGPLVLRPTAGGGWELVPA